jgi:hypothetical protein
LCKLIIYILLLSILFSSYPFLPHAIILFSQEAALTAVAGYALKSLAEGGSISPTQLVKARQSYTTLKSQWLGGSLCGSSNNNNNGGSSGNNSSMAGSNSNNSGSGSSSSQLLPTLAEVTCLIWFEYLCGGFEAAAAKTVDAVLSFGSSQSRSTPAAQPDTHSAGSLFHEQLTCACLRLLHYHCSTQVVKPAVMRDALVRALAIFPANPEMHVALIVGEAR